MIGGVRMSYIGTEGQNEGIKKESKYNSAIEAKYQRGYSDQQTHQRTGDQSDENIVTAYSPVGSEL